MFQLKDDTHEKMKRNNSNIWLRKMRTPTIFNSKPQYWGLPKIIIVLSWNHRGLSQPAIIPALCELIRVRRPDVAFLFEHISYGVMTENLHSKLHFSWFFVDYVGRSGGLAIFWNTSNNISILSYSMNHRIQDRGRR